MGRRFKRLLRCFLLCVACCCIIVSAHEQDQYADTTVTDSALLTSADTATAINGEYVEPERPVVYNTSAPGNAQWRQVVSDKAYSYRDKREYVAKDEKEEKEPWIITLLLAIYYFLTSPFGQFILWSAFILIIAYVVYRVISGQGGWIFGAKDRKGIAEQADELSEQSLLETDWELLMREALESGDKRNAIRYSYLCLLQVMQASGIIAYRPDKTNTDYYRELADKPQRQAFRDVSRQYEWTWYGNFLPESEALQRHMQAFRQLKQSLVSA